MIDDGVADLGVGYRLDVGGQEPHFAGRQFAAGNGFGRLVAHRVHFEYLVVGPQADLLAHAQMAVHHAHQNDDTAVAVEPGIENQRAQGQIGRAFGRRHQHDDGFQDVVNADSLFGAGQHGIARIQADDGFDLLANPLRLGRREIDLVDDRNDFQVVVQGQVRVGQRLRFHALGGVHHQKGAFAGLQAARHLVREIHVAGRIDQVELVPVAVVGLVVQAHGVGLDGDAALALQVHGVQHLLHHFALRKGAGGL